MTTLGRWIYQAKDLQQKEDLSVHVEIHRIAKTFCSSFMKKLSQRCSFTLFASQLKFFAGEIGVDVSIEIQTPC